MLIFCYDTALEYWRLQASAYKSSNSAAKKDWSAYKIFGVKESKAKPSIIPPDLTKLKSEAFQEFTPPIHLMLASKSARRVSRITCQHVFTGQTPDGSFYRDANDLIISSPEFCFYQMARKLSLVKLIELAFELCGSYSLPTTSSLNKPEQLPVNGFYKRAPLTNKKKLATFASKMSGVNGNRKVKQALRFVIEGSASPMETKLALLLTLPYRLGGYCFEAPVMNNHIVINKSLKSIANKRYYSCDLYWPDYNLAVEYNSNLHHTGPTHITNDSSRRNSLTSIGTTIIIVTNEHMQNSKNFEEIARQLAVLMGKRMVFKKPEFYTARLKLHGELLRGS